MNVPDFERAGLRRKTGLKFLLKLQDGKPENAVAESELASSLSTVLQQDDVAAGLLSANEFHVGLNTKYELTVTHISRTEAEEPLVVSGDSQ